MPSAFPRTVAVGSALVIGSLFAPALPVGAAIDEARRMSTLISRWRNHQD